MGGKLQIYIKKISEKINMAKDFQIMMKSMNQFLEISCSTIRPYHFNTYYSIASTTLTLKTFTTTTKNNNLY